MCGHVAKCPLRDRSQIVVLYHPILSSILLLCVPQMTMDHCRFSCSECGETSDFRPNKDGAIYCPRCGGTKGQLNVGFSLSVGAQVSSVRAVGKNDSLPSKKKRRLEYRKELSLTGSTGKMSILERLIDKDNNLYWEKVTDKDTGEVVHSDEEPLTDHTNHGTAKKLT